MNRTNLVGYLMNRGLILQCVLNIFADASLKGKSVLLVGGPGTLRSALQCLTERNGMTVQTNHWNSKSLKTQVCSLVFICT